LADAAGKWKCEDLSVLTVATQILKE